MFIGLLTLNDLWAHPLILDSRRVSFGCYFCKYWQSGPKLVTQPV